MKKRGKPHEKSEKIEREKRRKTIREKRGENDMTEGKTLLKRGKLREERGKS